MKKITKEQFEEKTLNLELNLKTRFGTPYANFETSFDTATAFKKIGIQFNKIERNIDYIFKKTTYKTQTTLFQNEYVFEINGEKYFWYELDANELGIDIVLTKSSLNSEELFMLVQESITDFRKEFDYDKALDTYEIIEEGK